MPAIALNRFSIRSLLHAGFKATQARLRSIGLAKTNENWSERAEICERCPLCVRQCNVSYCGKPFLQMAIRNPETDGCGCPTRAKAKDPNEHCPLNVRHRGSRRVDGVCDCKWCTAAYGS